MTEETTSATSAERRDGSALSEGLGLVPDRATLDELAAQALAQMDKACDFPANTCGASRHVAFLAEAVLKGEPCHQLTDEPQHCAESMAWTVASLWYARTELRRAKDELDAERERCEKLRAFAQAVAERAFEHHQDYWSAQAREALRA